ncbi:hypothetical protein R6Z07F_009081 [Ovis aries]
MEVLRCKGTFPNMPDNIGWKMTWLKSDDLTSILQKSVCCDIWKVGAFLASAARFTCLMKICTRLQKKCQFSFSKRNRYVPHSCPKHAALCCIKLLKLCCEEARNCLKGQGLKRSIAQLFTTQRFRFQIWLSYHPEAGAAPCSTGDSRSPFKSSRGFLVPAPGAPPSARGSRGREATWAGAQEFPLSSNGDPVIPERLLYSGPSSQVDQSLPSEESAGRRRRGHRLERLRGRGAEGAGRARTDGWVLSGQLRSRSAPPAPFPAGPGLNGGWGERELDGGGVRVVPRSTRAGHREQRARVARNRISSDRIPPPQPNGEISGNMATEHVNGNGTEEPMDTTSAVIHSENFQTLLDAGLPQKVAEKLDEIYVAGLVAHSDLDERAIEALKEFNEDGALAVLQQFKDSDLSHVQNKSAFLCGVMKTYRQREKQGTKVADSSKGPDEAKIKALLERTGYTLDVTTGQRKYGGPPPDSVYSGQQPSVGTEIFVGKIPRDLFEDELVPLFEKAGPIWDLRLMMDPLTGLNRGYAFVTFCTKEAAQEAVKLYNNHEIRSGKHIGVCISVANNRLFVGSIPKSKTKEQILEEFSKVTEGLTDVILYHQPDDKKKNRGFCFLEYEDHKTAAQARRRLMSGKVKVWGNVGTVEWADPIEDPDPEVMAKVKVLFVRNLANTVTEEILEKAFSQFGKLERVKKLKDYAFIHFDERDGAVKAMEEMNGKDLEGENIEIVFAKPPDQKRKERKAQRQAAKNQMYDDYYYYGPPHMPPPTRGRGRGGRGGYGYPPDYYGYEDYYDYYGYDYHNYQVAGLLLPVVEPVIHREEVLDQQEAFVVREEVPNNKEAAGREKGSRPVLTCYNED